jgi:hypothetical protein
VIFCRNCTEVVDEHYHRRCVRCRHGWVEQTTAQPKRLTVRMLGGDVELACRCGLSLVQAPRAPIADRCPKCGAEWSLGTEYSRSNANARAIR